jgi:hypothetical protein
MNRTAAPFWGLLAVGAAAAVGATTHDAGFTAITFIGTLVLPRILGVRGGHHHGACAGRHAGRARIEDRLAEWHRQAHGDTPPAPRDAAPVA